MGRWRGWAGVFFLAVGWPCHLGIVRGVLEQEADLNVGGRGVLARLRGVDFSRERVLVCRTEA